MKWGDGLAAKGVKYLDAKAGSLKDDEDKENGSKSKIGMTLG